MAGREWTAPGAPRPATAERLARRVRGLVPRPGFVLDHDGTLVPFRRDPARALPSARARRAVARLLETGHPVCIVSGRPLSFLRRAWDVPGLDLAGSHGAERARVRAGASVTVGERRRAEAIRLEGAVRKALHGAPRGLFVESKPFGVAVHVRPLPPAARAGWLAEAERAMRAALPRGYGLLHGSCVVEARPRGADKGRLVRGLRGREARWRGRPVFAAGDDRTDEDVFAALEPGDVSVLIARRARPSAAGFRLRSIGELRRLLEAVTRGGKEG